MSATSWMGTTQEEGPMDKELMTTNEAAEYLGVTPHTLRVWRTKDVGPPYLKMGDAKQARVRYERRNVVEWRNARVRNAEAV